MDSDLGAAVHSNRFPSARVCRSETLTGLISGKKLTSASHLSYLKIFAFKQTETIKNNLNISSLTFNIVARRKIPSKSSKTGR